MVINAKFEFVSETQFVKDYVDSFGVSEQKAKEIYRELKKPKRATTGSAGYDFFIPDDLVIKPNQTVKIPTGIRAYMPNDYVLLLYPRSSLGFKYRMQLNNTVGVIDSDYYNALNEGHIMIKVTNDTNENKEISLTKGDGFAQGIFMQYGITIDDCSNESRIGGFGSTNK